MKAVIIIPTYNEKGNVEKLIEILESEVFPKIKKHEIQILVVDDSSPDGTAEEVKKLSKKYSNLNLLINEHKLGLGAAYIKGMTYAMEKFNPDVLFQMDADLSHDPYKIPEFLSAIESGSDLVVGSRYIKGGSIPENWGIHRKIFSVFGNLIVKSILMRFWHHDWTTGYRALKSKVFEDLKNELVEFKGYTFQVSFLHKAIAKGYKVSEIPFHFTDRTLGKSKIAPREYIFDLLRYLTKARGKELVHSPFLKYAITGFFGYLINAVTLEIFKKTLGVHAGIAAMMGAELSIIWNFLMNNFWAFSHQKIQSPIKFILKFLQFNLVSAGSLGIITAVVFLGTHFFGDTLLVRQVSLVVAIVFFVIPYSYSMYNIFIWKRWQISSLSKLQKLVG